LYGVPVLPEDSSIMVFLSGMDPAQHRASVE